MKEAIEFLVRYGGVIVFAIVFLEQMGLPTPAIPILLAVGALAGSGKMSLGAMAALAVAASLVADLLWFYLGRW